jgi:hypothetical protein
LNDLGRVANRDHAVTPSLLRDSTSCYFNRMDLFIGEERYEIGFKIGNNKLVLSDKNLMF